MTRSWDENRAAVNQLWPMMTWTDEERRLWHDDLSGLDQDVLYDALRNVKRTRDSNYPHLAWVLDSYRDMETQRKRLASVAAKATPSEPKLKLEIADDEDHRLREDFIYAIEHAQPHEFHDIEAMVLDNLQHMHSHSAIRVLAYARARLLGEQPMLSRVTKDGNTHPLAVGGVG